MKLCKHPGCNYPVFSKGFCKIHYPKKPIRPKVYRIPRSSKKQKTKNNEYSKIRKEFFSKPENQICKANLPGCIKLATEIHHKKGRGIYFLDTSSFLPVCRICHNFIEEHSEKAKELNLSENRLYKISR